MKPNDIQIGGGHYKEKEYQHWDMAIDTGIHYLLGCATKYPSRWRTKNGIEDLRKACHYIAKAEECDIWPDLSPKGRKHAHDFYTQLQQPDADIVECILLGRYDEARYKLTDLIEETLKEE